MGIPSCPLVAAVCLLCIVPPLFNGPVGLTSARPLRSFQPLRQGPKYAFRCEPECTRRVVRGFGKPVTWAFSNHSVASSNAYGVWGVDPTTHCGTIYLAPGYSGVRSIYKYESMEDLQNEVKTGTITLPSPGAAGTGAVIFNGSVYYNEASTAKLWRRALKGEGAASATLDDSAYHTAGGYYRSGGYSHIDFAVSETGLYAIYPSKSRGLTIAVAKLNPHTLKVEKQFHFNEKKQSFGNCFIVCATLYCTSSYTAKVTTVTFGYDFNEQVELTTGFSFVNNYKVNSMIDYNPVDRKLYSWDNKHLVTYEVIFDE